MPRGLVISSKRRGKRKEQLFILALKLASLIYLTGYVSCANIKILKDRKLKLCKQSNIVKLIKYYYQQRPGCLHFTMLPGLFWYVIFTKTI